MDDGTDADVSYIFIHVKAEMNLRNIASKMAAVSSPIHIYLGYNFLLLNSVDQWTRDEHLQKLFPKS